MDSHFLHGVATFQRISWREAEQLTEDDSADLAGQFHEFRLAAKFNRVRQRILLLQEGQRRA
jgi:hypothetical protein